MRHRISLLGALMATTILSCWSEESPSSDVSIGDGYCESLNCTDLLHVAIERRDQGKFIAGVYRFEFELSQVEPITIECSLKEIALLTCEGVPNDAAFTVDNTLTTFAFRTPETPSRLVATAYYETDEIGTSTLTPRYEIIAQSDPSCRETCYEGTAILRTTALDANWN